MEGQSEGEGGLLFIATTGAPAVRRRLSPNHAFILGSSVIHPGPHPLLPVAVSCRQTGRGNCPHPEGTT